MGWVNVTHAIFGSGAALLEFHITAGVVWSAGFLMYGLARFKRITLPFIKEILTFSPANDVVWLFKKILSMTIGTRAMQRVGLKSSLPDQGFYNVGQKMFGITALLGGVVIAVTGWIMLYSQEDLSNPGTVQWAILIHFISVGIVFAGLLVHIYMAVIARGQMPALLSMFTGNVSSDYAIQHHKRWYDEMQPPTPLQETKKGTS
jgi:formate dehydrogenase subunit gamma